MSRCRALGEYVAVLLDELPAVFLEAVLELRVGDGHDLHALEVRVAEDRVVVGVDYRPRRLLAAVDAGAQHALAVLGGELCEVFDLLVLRRVGAEIVEMLFNVVFFHYALLPAHPAQRKHSV